MEFEYDNPARAHEADMERTIQELNKRKRELEEAIQEPSPEDTLEIFTKAYEEVAESKPFLPAPGSVLPALLAIRNARNTINESNEYLESKAKSQDELARKLEAEKTALREQQALKTALENRIQSLRDGLENKQEKTPEQMAKERIAELKRQKEEWENRTAKLTKDLDWFIEEHLGPMLAAEELGGPVVGQLTDIDPEDLSAGFSAQGKLKKAKDQPDIDKRQRRIDEIWGAQDQQGESNKRKREEDEASAAVADIRRLIEQLMNKLVESQGDNSASYLKISKETAAVRFLVRSKVASFHPKDAQKLRLVDFGRDIDD
ncbi:uncharacterized protein PODANS_1_10890 [Podospora anserina S mat+]|uniref:Podospora anserina S mat+ genomic DNA chromosome 1, supercontig 2 n=1 Tax=Podospora anserina (strain S / ATCC MYA-4624 / DSM 980 / FGSC 10383) TaxID=515849 RepID=B2AYF1_PODAN|nr:uncharacterized protein PODANS_1_10890 [Podospora anserina S mat+]CAP69425.1 unnamed protein product [Podospora anserina S mat+]CDP23449.1 Putative protein of unknown function [Podospora anserina S mat+]